MKAFFRSEAGRSPVVVSAVFPAPPERLFDAWTRPEDLRKWFGQQPTRLGDIEIDLREGGAWRFHMCSDAGDTELLEGTYLRIHRAKLLSFSWTHLMRAADGTEQKTQPSYVTITFEPFGAATKMTLEHREIVTEEGRLGVGSGWVESFRTLYRLAAAGTTIP